jgi:hypothetical protein
MMMLFSVLVEDEDGRFLRYVGVYLGVFKCQKAKTTITTSVKT